jgi:ATP-dependent Clp protease ATP-binding subunit ClpA
MSQPSPGLAVAWRIAATEAGAAGCKRIECSHLMMGLLSLDKATARVLQELGFGPAQAARVGAERAAIEDFLAASSLSPQALRRDLRARVKRRPEATQGMMSRSTAARAAFVRAEALAPSGNVNSLHLLGALLRDSDPAIVSVMTARRLGRDLAERAEAAAAKPIGGRRATNRTVEQTVPAGLRPRPITQRGPAPPPAKVAVTPAVSPVPEVRLIKLEAHLKSKIVGQDEAVAKVAARIRKACSAAPKDSGPLAVFLLLGPAGVGRTETARTLATYLFDGADALARFDMSEVADDRQMSRLLAEALRQKPRSVLLFHEVEKANAKTLELIRQVVVQGEIADAQGGGVSAREAVVVITSLLPKGSAPAAGKTAPPMKTGKPKGDLPRLLGADLLNRIDDTLTFRALDEADARRIARPLLAALVARARKEYKILLNIEPEAERLIARLGFQSQGGVPELRATIERLVETPLAGLAKTGKLAKNPVWRAVHDEGGIYILPQ